MKKALSQALIWVAALLFKVTILILLVPLMVALFVGGLAYGITALVITLFRHVILMGYRIGLLKYGSPNQSAPRTSAEP